MSAPNPNLAPGAYKFTVNSAAEAVTLIRERLGPAARVLSVRSVEARGLKKLLGGSQLEVVAQVDPAPGATPMLDATSAEPALPPAVAESVPTPPPAAPTAGLSPDAFASLMLVRGPQTVRYGPSVAGVLSFARDDRAWQQSGARLSTQLTRGSWDRHDDSLTASVGDGRFGLAM
ncbi:MAG TPA: hypothetical protein PLB90_16145, partial [Opitutaceae bacterium]|nr:hypothetical protein [Opitutaceae bacterium]